jgi:hypothetical protein
MHSLINESAWPASSSRAAGARDRADGLATGMSGESDAERRRGGERRAAAAAATASEGDGAEPCVEVIGGGAWWGPAGIHVVAPEHNSVSPPRPKRGHVRRTWLCLHVYRCIRSCEQFRSHCCAPLPYVYVYSDCLPSAIVSFERASCNSELSV